MLKKAIVAVIVVIALGAIASSQSGGSKSTTITPGGTTAAATGTAAPQAKVSDKVSSGNWEYTVTKVEKVKTLVWSDLASGKTDALGTWAVVSLTLKNIGKQNFPINGFDFNVTDAAGIKYDPSTKLEASMFVSHAKLTNLGAQFPPGVEVKTALVFDVSPDAKSLKLVLKQANNTTIALE